METARSMLTARKISMEDGRLVLCTSKSAGFVAIFAMLTVGGVLLWGIFDYTNQELAKRVSPAQLIFGVAVFVVMLVTIAVVCFRVFPELARVARQGDVIVFDRERDVLLRNDERLAPLSSVKKVQINAYMGTWYTKSGQRPWTVSVLAQGDAEPLELGAAYERQAQEIAKTIAEYTGAQICRVRRTDSPF
jgi:hypothetical protein